MYIKYKLEFFREIIALSWIIRGYGAIPNKTLVMGYHMAAVTQVGKWMIHVLPLLNFTYQLFKKYFFYYLLSFLIYKKVTFF